MNIKDKILKIIKEVEISTGFKVLYNIDEYKNIVFFYIHPNKESCYYIPMSLNDLTGAKEEEVEELRNSLLNEIKGIANYE